MNKRNKIKIIKISHQVNVTKPQDNQEELEILRKDIQHCFHIVRA